MPTTNKIRTFDSSIDIELEARQGLIQVLNAQLADTFDMFSLAKQAHWNVRGPQFFPLHELFDLIAEGLMPYTDMIAERVTALGGRAMGTNDLFIDVSRDLDKWLWFLEAHLQD